MTRWTHRIACVDVGAVLEILEHLLRVASPRSSKEGGRVVRLQQEERFRIGSELSAVLLFDASLCRPLAISVEVISKPILLVLWVLVMACRHEVIMIIPYIVVSYACIPCLLCDCLTYATVFCVMRIMCLCVWMMGLIVREKKRVSPNHLAEYITCFE